MLLSRLRQKLAAMSPGKRTHKRPRPWPVDPDLTRRATEARKQIAHTRRQIERHLSRARGRDGGGGDEASSTGRAARR